MIEVGLVDLVVRPRPVRPEVPQIRANGLGLPVDELLGKVEAVKGGVPELPRRLRGQHPLARAGERRRDDERTHQIRPRPGDGLGDEASDVVSRDHGGTQPQLFDQPDDAPGLCRPRIGFLRLVDVLVGVPEAAEVGHDDLGGAGQERHQIPIIGSIAGPTVQEDDGRAGADPIIGEPETIDR